MAAELLGIKLSRAEQEEHQPVVRAEISDMHISAIPEGAAAKRTLTNGAKSTVCALQ